MLLASFLICLLPTQVFAIPGYGPNYPTGDANYQQKLSWFTRFADAAMYPNNTAEASKINSTLFAENVQGRVDLTSTFDGRELNTEVNPLNPFHRLICSTSLDYFRQLQQICLLEYSISLVFLLIIL